MWGAVVGAIQAATPLVVWWLDGGVGFVVVAAAAITATPWLLVVGFAGHGIKDFWQHRTRFVRNTRWWPPFCATVDFVVAAAIAVEIAAGLDFG